MPYDYAIHSDFLIHWTGKDIDQGNDWYQKDKSKTDEKKTSEYIKRLKDILTYGLWMTEEEDEFLSGAVKLPSTAKCCFTELKVSESRKHAREYGRLGIGLKRPFLFTRFGRPLVYFGFEKDKNNDKFLRACAEELKNKDMLNFFKPMNKSSTLNYDLYGESEWRIIFFEELLQNKKIIDPRDPSNDKEHKYFQSLDQEQQNILKYLIPLDGWFSMIIYPSLQVKNKAQQDSSCQIKSIIENIKRDKKKDRGNQVEDRNWPIEVDLDACRNF